MIFFKNNSRKIIIVAFLLLFCVILQPAWAGYLSPVSNPIQGNVYPPIYNQENVSPTVYAIIDRILAITGDLLGSGNITIGGNYSGAGNSTIDGTLSIIGNATLGNIISTASLFRVANAISASTICYIDGTNCRNLSDSWASSGPIVESDPIVPANLKDGIDWTEIDKAGSFLADGVDDVGFTNNEMSTNVANGNFKTGGTGYDLNNGQYNTVVSTYHYVMLNNTGSRNTVIGYRAAQVNTSGNDNVVVGGFAFYDNQTGSNNIAIGVNALGNNISGSGNTAQGNDSLLYNTTGGQNTAIGHRSMLQNTTGIQNTVVGFEAAHNSSAYSNNTVVGYRAFYNGTGSNGVFIGKLAGYNNVGDNMLIIESQGGGAPNGGASILSGDFSAGNVYVNGVLVHSSDARLKHGVRTINGALDRVKNLQGVEYAWKKSNKKDLGFVAQDMEKVFPELVSTDESQPEKYKSIAYEKLVAPIIEALKEQGEQINKQDQEIQDIKNDLRSLR